MTDSVLTADQVRSLFRYEPDTGEFRWLIAPKKKTPDGMAGTVNKFGYRTVEIGRKRYLCHRVIWLFQTGRMPDVDIDHVNGNPGDNRWANLRQATKAQNSCNRKAKRTSKSGIKGIYLCPQTKKWRVTIQADGIERTIGRYATKEEAAEVYRREALRRHGEFACISRADGDSA